MTPEEKDIKNKIDNLCDLDVFFNDSHLWERVEARLDQKKKHRSILGWYWMAASLIIGALSYFFLLPAATNPQSKYIVTKPAATPTTIIKPRIGIELKPHTPPTSLSKNKEIEPIPIKENTEETKPEEKLLTVEVTQLNAINKTLLITTPKDILQHPIAYKAQRVATLTLPVIPDKMMERESFAKRALRQVRHFNTEGKIDLRELNIEPLNVWAYLERSFFHDTTKITNTKPPK